MPAPKKRQHILDNSVINNIDESCKIVSIQKLKNNQENLQKLLINIHIRRTRDDTNNIFVKSLL